jgi:hypothetical protein
MHSVALLDCAGRRRSPATLSGFHQGQPPRNRGLRYPPDPPTVEEIIAVMRAAGDRPAVGYASSDMRDASSSQPVPPRLFRPRAWWR